MAKETLKQQLFSNPTTLCAFVNALGNKADDVVAITIFPSTNGQSYVLFYKEA